MLVLAPFLMLIVATDINSPGTDCESDSSDIDNETDRGEIPLRDSDASLFEDEYEGDENSHSGYYSALKLTDIRAASSLDPSMPTPNPIPASHSPGRSTSPPPTDGSNALLLFLSTYSRKPYSSLPSCHQTTGRLIRHFR